MPHIKAQAVLVIHGIGEQQPMETLRSFVGAMLPGASVRSKPDPISGSYELRRLSAVHAPGSHTDFFELYWADKVEGTRLKHVFQWLRRLLLRRPNHVPAHLKLLWLCAWLVLLLLAAAVVLYLVLRAMESLPSRTSLLLSILVPLALLVPNAFLIYYLGDAARYLSPSPSNIAVRRAIREAGVEVLRRLHAQGKYDRIVVVGHSLGSVIAYETLSYYWAEIHDQFSNPSRLTQAKLAAFERLVYGTEPIPSTTHAAYRTAQRALWLEMRRQGHRWKVTDLVTLGSPLAHAEVLLAAHHQDLIQRIRDRELPSNPPQPDERGRLSFVVPTPMKNSRGVRVRPRVPHHAALFCCTRWTNIYFPVIAGFFGDIVAGPLERLFGEGIADIPLSSGGLWRYTPWSHVRYWRKQRTAVLDSQDGGYQALHDALDLRWGAD